MTSSTSPPQHLLDLLTPLYSPDTEFVLKPTSSRNKRESFISPSAASSIRYLYKTSSISKAEQLRGEAESLRCMGEACQELVPRLIGSGELSAEEGEEGEKEFWMLTEWHNLSHLSKEEDEIRLGKLLAKMHKHRFDSAQKGFGFPVPTYCGVTRQDNDGEIRDWAKFWSEKRIGSLVERIRDPEIDELAKQVRDRVFPNLLGKLKDVQPSILHGDLWSGNVGFSENRQGPVIFDPSSYYGHSEADLGMTRMFGGFSNTFYESYHEELPKTEPTEEYETRLDCYELYHHLNHMLMFGRSYKGGAVRLMKKLLEWANTNGF